MSQQRFGMEIKMKAEKTKETEFQADEVIGRIRAKMAWVSEKTETRSPILRMRTEIMTTVPT